MKIKYAWFFEYGQPGYWNSRTPLWLDMPRLINFYFDLNDNKVRNFLKIRKGKILDSGCGDGRFLPYADVGVDFSKGMLKKAKYKGRDLVRASILHLPFKNKSFDVAFMVDVLLHIEPDKQKQALTEAKRVAKTVYNFLGEHRTILPFIIEALRNIHFIPRGLIPFVALLFPFPIDRIKKLVIQRAPTEDVESQK